MAYEKKADMLRVCRHCGRFYLASPMQWRRMYCFRDECRAAEDDRAYKVERTWRAQQPKVKKKRAKVFKLTVRIKKTCLQCGRTYWDYGDSHFGRCPACKELEFYGETDYGTI